MGDRPLPATPRSSHSTKLRVHNLPHTATFTEVSGMTTACGNVKTIQVEGNTATIEFMDGQAAEKFIAMYNRKMMDLSILTVTRIM